MGKTGKDSSDQLMGADHSSACYGLALLPVSFVWDVFKFSGIAFVAFLMLSGIMILLTGDSGLLQQNRCKVGHVILVYYKWICGCSMKLPGAVRITGRPGPGQIMGYIVVWGSRDSFIEMAYGKKAKRTKKSSICSCCSDHISSHWFYYSFSPSG